MEEIHSTYEKERFVNVSSKMPMMMLKVDGTFYESFINIAISPINREHFINVDVANQLHVLEAYIEKKEEKVKQLDLRINSYNMT